MPGAREDPNTQVVSGEGNFIDKILWLTGAGRARLSDPIIPPERCYPARAG